VALRMLRMRRGVGSVLRESCNPEVETTKGGWRSFYVDKKVLKREGASNLGTYQLSDGLRLRRGVVRAWLECDTTVEIVEPLIGLCGYPSDAVS